VELAKSFSPVRSQRETTPEFTRNQSADGLAMNDRPSLGVEVKFLDPLRDSNWDRLVTSHPDFNFFHSTAWAKVLCKTYGHKATYLHFSRRHELVALVPMMEIRSALTGRRGVCLPFSDFCGPLMFDKSESGAVLDKLVQLARERSWRYFEVRGGRGMLPAIATSASQFYGHKLLLPERSEELLARFTSPARRAIRKAEKSEAEVRVVTTREAILEFYSLHVKTRRRHGLPPQPLSFFINIYEEIIKAGHGFVVVARSGSRSFAAAVFFQFGKNAIYKFGASDEAFQELRGNNLVMWEAIKFLIRHGFKSLHFGRTDLDNEGLRHFKSGWGTEEELIEYFRFDIEAESWKTTGRNGSGFHNRIFRRMPLLLNRLAGSVIYPHLD
jgi:Acetyltransferase (GNAT) domain